MENTFIYLFYFAFFFSANYYTTSTNLYSMNLYEIFVFPPKYTHIYIYLFIAHLQVGAPTTHQTKNKTKKMKNKKIKKHHKVHPDLCIN